jgi:ABC-type phosphate/phosphonate transport system substrate-binding protein
MNNFITMFLILCTLAGAVRGDGKDPKSTPSPIRIAVVDTFFRDIPEPMARPLIEPFRLLMVSQTGMDGEVVLPEESMKLAQDLAEEKIHVALFHGFEFAWAQHQYPDLQPLMIAVHQQRYLQVFLMVRADSPIRSFADLQGKTTALPCFCQEHCWIYMERACRDANQADPRNYFASLTHPANAEVGLDELADGKVQAVIVDNIALDSYKQRKPARFAKLKAVQKSEDFPSAVIAYRKGTIDPTTVKLFQESLLKGQNTALGRQLLTLWKLSALERLPVDFDKSLDNIMKAYPPPEGTRAVKNVATNQTAVRGKAVNRQ